MMQCLTYFTSLKIKPRLGLLLASVWKGYITYDFCIILNITLNVYWAVALYVAIYELCIDTYLEHTRNRPVLFFGGYISPWENSNPLQFSK